jgi:hypothetical protein
MGCWTGRITRAQNLEGVAVPAVLLSGTAQRSRSGGMPALASGCAGRSCGARTGKEDARLLDEFKGAGGIGPKLERQNKPRIGVRAVCAASNR